MYDLKRYTKFFVISRNAPRGKWACSKYVKLMKHCGVKTKKMSKPETLELAKIICDTSYLGWLINYAQLSNRIAIQYGADYDEMWSFSDEIQEFLGNRPKMYPGYIGGHCVIPNLDLMHSDVLNLIKKMNIPVFGFNKNINFESCTPTGLSLLKNFKFDNFDASKIISTGFGAGNADLEDFSNSISVSIMRPNTNSLDKLSIIETNIDDMSPEVVPYLMEKIVQIGAKDVWCSNILMKKNRPAIMFSVLCDREIIEQVVSIINEEFL
jgi:hypothetical protein